MWCSSAACARDLPLAELPRNRHSAALGQHPRTVDLGHGAGEVIALHLIASDRCEEVQLLLRFDSLGDHFQTQVVSQADNRLCDGGIIRIGHAVAHEFTVNFERVEWKALEIGET